MPGKTRNQVFILFLIIFILLLDKRVIAQYQPFLDKKVSFTFSSTTLSNALRAIGSKTGVKFSYNPELIPPGKRITMRFNDLPLREVLKQLINDPTISFREIGNQIVMYRGDPSQFPLEANQQLIVGKPQIIIPAKKIPDTVYVYQLDTLIIDHTDTIFRMVSLTRYDTIRILDTVFIEKNRPAKKPAKIQNPDFEKNSVKHQKFLENNGFYSGLYYEMLFGSATFTSTSPEYNDYQVLMKQANSGSLAKFSTGVIAGYEYHRIGIRTGIGFARLGEKFAYAYNIETGGFYRTDTIEKYYTLTGIDTSWFYITDSTWIPKELKNFNYQNPNTFRYIDVPLTLKLRFWQNQSAEIYALGGIKASFLVAVDALMINVDNKNDVIWVAKSDLNPILLSWQAGIGTAVKFSPRSGIIAEASYNKQTNSQYKNLPLEKKYGLIGIKIAAYIKF
jgi:hypothetical protein